MGYLLAVTDTTDQDALTHLTAAETRLSDVLARPKRIALGCIVVLTALGWLALAFAAAHSVYFILFPGAMVVQWTGYAATALLGVGGLLGLITSYNTFLRLWAHRIIAILMVIALGLHWFPFVPAATLFLVGLSVAGLAHLKLVSSLVRISQV